MIRLLSGQRSSRRGLSGFAIPALPVIPIGMNVLRAILALHITPLSVADKFHEQMEQQGGAWIFTSATLAVNEDFSHFSERLGLKPKQQFSLESPFDYQQQALLCVPRFLPEPNSFGIADRLVDMLAPVIEENQGRCFFLCTSHQMVRDLAEGFRAKLDLPVLVQGKPPNRSCWRNTSSGAMPC